MVVVMMMIIRIITVNDHVEGHDADNGVDNGYGGDRNSGEGFDFYGCC